MEGPVSQLLERPGSVELAPEAERIDTQTNTYLDLPVELPMLAPELPVQSARVLSPLQIRIERKQTPPLLIEIPIAIALEAVEAATDEEFVSLSQFLDAVESMFTQCGISSRPPHSVLIDLFHSLHSAQTSPGVIPKLHVATALALLAGGSEEERIAAIFKIADLNHDNALSLNELVGFFSLVFGNVLTKSLLGVMNANGVPLSSSQQLAVATAMACMDMCDLNKDGTLSLSEFTKWFNQPRLLPSVAPFAHA